MSLKKIIGMSIAGMIGIACVLTVIALFLTPVLINQQQVRQKIETTLSGRLGGQLSYEAIDLSFFPPRGNMTQLKVDAAGYQGSIASITVYLKILPLFRGRPEIKTLHIRHPDVSITVPETSDDAGAQDQPVSLNQIQKIIADLYTWTENRIPGAAITISNATIEVAGDDRTICRLQNAEGSIDLSPGQLVVEFQSESDIWRHLTYSATIGNAGSKLKMQLNVRQLRPGSLVSLPEEASARVPDHMNLQISMRTSDFEKIDGNVEGSADYQDLPYPIEISGAEFTYTPDTPDQAAVKDLSAGFGNSSVSQLSGTLNLGHSMNLNIKSAQAHLDLDQLIPAARDQAELKQKMQKFQIMSGSLNISDLQLNGPLRQPQEWEFKGRAEVNDCKMKTDFLPEAVLVKNAVFLIRSDKVDIQKATAAFMDTDLSLSGNLHGSYRNITSINLKPTGDIGTKTLDWLRRQPYIPDKLTIDKPVTVSSGRLNWKKKGPFKLAADFEITNGPGITVDMTRSNQTLDIKKISIADETSSAEMSLALSEQMIDLSFKGNLTRKTILTMVPDKNIGWIKGDFKAGFDRKSRRVTGTDGTLQAGDFTYSRNLSGDLELNRLAVKAEDKQITITTGNLTYDQTRMDLTGDVGFSGNNLTLDLMLNTGGLNYDKIEQILSEEKIIRSRPSGQHEKETTRSFAKSAGPFGFPLQGTITIDADYFRYRDLKWKPFDMAVRLKDRHVTVDLKQGSLCGIQAEATASVHPAPMELEANASARNEPLKQTLNCFLDSKLMSGEFDMSGHLTTSGRIADFLKNLQGNFNLTATDGRVYRLGLLAKIFAVLNITELLKGDAPDIIGKGFGYNKLQARGSIHKGMVTLSETYINGQSLDIAFRGEINLPEKTIDITALVTPLKTADSILERIPYLSRVTGKYFMAIPVEVKGPIDQPEVRPVPPSDVAKGLLGVLQRTATLPVHILQPFAEEDNKDKQPRQPAVQ